MKVLSTHLDDMDVHALRAQAAKRQMSLHAYTQLLLRRVARKDDMPDTIGPTDVRPSVLNEVPKPIAVKIRIKTAMRLAYAAYALAMPTSTLARSIITHFLGRRSDVMQKLQDIPADYNQGPGFQGILKTTGGVRRYKLVILVSPETAETARQAAIHRNTTQADLVRDILDAALPQFDVVDAYCQEFGE